jgi:hypothetical protein
MLKLRNPQTLLERVDKGDSHVLGKFINSVVEKFELFRPEYAPVTA